MGLLFDAQADAVNITRCNSASSIGDSNGSPTLTSDPDAHVGIRGATVHPDEQLRKDREQALDARLEGFGSLLDDYIFNTPSGKTDAARRFAKFMRDTSETGELGEAFDLSIIPQLRLTDTSVEETLAEIEVQATAKSFMSAGRRIAIAYELHKERFPTQIWTCCKKHCFANVATDRDCEELFHQVALIHQQAERHHASVDNVSNLIAKRRRGVGTSTVAYTAPSRREREEDDEDEGGTERQQALRKLAKFVVEVLPFLYGQETFPNSDNIQDKKLCTEAICCILGVSRNFLYHRRKNPTLDSSNEEMLDCLVDEAGIRLQQLRRSRDRGQYPPLEQLTTFECGCDVPCFADVSELQLLSEYEEFAKLSRELKPRHRENQYLLNRMFCPLSNSTTRVCNRALSSLYTVSETLIADVRIVLNTICDDPSLENREVLRDGAARYKYNRTHPILKYKVEDRKKIESTLDMILRADPAGGLGGSICRVYSPEVNTMEKLQYVLMKEIDVKDSNLLDLSTSTLRRMLKDYLRRRKMKAISFTQSDHNACPNCKTLNYAILQYHHEAKILEQEVLKLETSANGSDEPIRKKRDTLMAKIREKRFQEDESIRIMQVHTERDKRIRGIVKRLADYFQEAENRHRTEVSRLTKKQQDEMKEFSVQWNSRRNMACMTHQDDMTKLDLPHFFVSASSDITRWRFDVNAHVSAITNNAVVFSHEQGTGPKNGSSIVEEILLEHLLSCRGESIKIVVSDNASVGKNWLTTIALPQYIVDQGLAEVVLILFLENNHGKWLADMLFGQFQCKRKRSVIVGIDDMLSHFEGVKRKKGTVRSFALNPLSSIDFAEVFKSLGYETKPRPEFGFVKRNIHFAAACTPQAKAHLPPELKDLLGPALPDDAGLVRISTEPQGLRERNELAYEDRYFDVPAVRLSVAEAEGRPVEENRDRDSPVANSPQDTDMATPAPLVVPLDRPFSLSGNGVVASRTADKVGYNGLVFRKTNACPELKDTSKALIRRAWPKGLLQTSVETISGEPVPGSESLKCAPLNWVARRPVSHFCLTEKDWKARYPPQNLLNAKYLKGPRETNPWVPTATYNEPPFPIIGDAPSCGAMREIAEEHTDLGAPLHILDILRAVYQYMGDRENVMDPWLQHHATIPSPQAIRKYRDELQLFVEREHGHPRMARNARHLFKENRGVQQEVDRIVQGRGVTGAAEKKLKAQTLAGLFEKAVNTPGKMEYFDGLVEKDLERYSRELKEFKKMQEEFDRAHGLLPVQKQD